MSLILLGDSIMLVFGTGLRLIHNGADYIGSWIFIAGLSMALLSLSIAAWRYLP
ncbi:hypothetical protein [Bordetella bronchialis]|uniref:hypothetical protein n=1 Tax=Bordetella bronchialis TaxID=463025 RepID=UPI0012EAA657|nr:hypothetical protein [Bordetella bronchialis]